MQLRGKFKKNAFTIGLNCLAFTALFNIQAIQAQPPIEAYGLDPSLYNMRLSPEGDIIAYTTWVEGKRAVVVKRLGSDTPLHVLDLTDYKLRDYRFLDNNYLIIYRSETISFSGYLGEYEFAAATSLNLETGDTSVLLRRGVDLTWPQLHLDRVLGPSEEEGFLLMTALSGEGASDNSAPELSLFKVDIETGFGRLVERGEKETLRIFTGPEDRIYAREDYSDFHDNHSVWAGAKGDLTEVYNYDTDILKINFAGFSPDRNSLIALHPNSEGFDTASPINLDNGILGSAHFSSQGRDIDQVITSWHQQVLGVRFSGIQPSYKFYDTELNIQVAELVSMFPESSVQVVDITQDLRQVLVLVQGNASSGVYLLSDRNAPSPIHLGQMHDEITSADLGFVLSMKLEMRDGLEIPILLTLPPGVDDPVNLPAIMLPHGGPESYDQLGFDTFAQYFASRGYLVIQPNFRGSSGFGDKFTAAGRGEWGRKMQDDLSDSLTALLNAGVVDPERVCIIGASYGGYTALAGGAFTPELYDCVVAIAPVSDLSQMLSTEEFRYGRDHWVVSYWNEVIGDRREDRDLLEDISPVNFAENFSAPVLLIHGDDDTVVPRVQSQRMQSALRRADKEVEMLRLRGDDHYLSHQETRLQALEAMSEFIETHIGGD